MENMLNKFNTLQEDYNKRISTPQGCIYEVEKVNQNVLASKIMEKLDIITIQDSKEMYYWNSETGLYEPCEGILNAIVQHVCQERTHNHIVSETVSSIQRQTYISREHLFPEPKYIPLQNGILDFEEMTLTPYSPNFKFFLKHPIEYRERNVLDILENPIDNFLNGITENQTDTLLIKEIIGYCFYREMPFQNFFILYGKGGNGKGVLLEIVQNMLGKEAYSNQSFQDLVEDKFSKMNLFGKNANIFGDLPARRLEDTAVIKMLSAGDEISGKQKFKGDIKFKSYAKLIASCNEVPETPDTSEGFWRRSEVINFPNCFYQKENRNLAKELCTPENLSDFFCSCLDAFKIALERNQFIRVESIDTKKRKYMSFSNSVASFADLMLEYDPDAQIMNDVVLQSYLKFCEGKKLPAKDERTFFKKLYEFFGHKIYKRRLSEGSSRQYITVGLTYNDKGGLKDFI